MKFRAKIKGTNEWIEGNSLVEESLSGDYVIMTDGISWVDGFEWSVSTKNWEYIDIETLEIIMAVRHT